MKITAFNKNSLFAVTLIVFAQFCIVFAEEQINISLQVDCNNNGVCEQELGENRANCSNDCPLCDNNGVCDFEWGETRVNCPADCLICDNNGVCDSDIGENETNCSNDCPAIGCNNNGVCEASREENSANCPNDCVVFSGGVGGQIRAGFSISGIRISDITFSSAKTYWTTDIDSRCELSFGRDLEYRQGVISETDFGKVHYADILDLSPAQYYHFGIVCTAASGFSQATGDYKFLTMDLPDQIPLANVSRFQAAAQNSLVQLRWQNPQDTDFAGVKILRSDKFYPRDLSEGIIIYDGKGGSFEDRRNDAEKIYYTAFAYDSAGNYASGATAIVSFIFESSAISDLPKDLAAGIGEIDLSQFEFVQNGKKIEPQRDTIEMQSLYPISISIPYDDVPEVLKTVMVTLEDETGKTFSFLLQVNQNKTAYEVTLSLPEAGFYNFEIAIFDYKNKVLKKISGNIKIIKAQLSEPAGEMKTYIVVRKIPPVIYIILTLAVALITMKIYRKIKKRHTETYGNE